MLKLAAACMVFAFLPTLTFLGHWGEVFGNQLPPPMPAHALIDLAAQRAEQQEHAQHCHTNLASCSAQPLPSGTGLLATHDVLLRPLPARVITVASANDRVLSGRVVSPLPHPPRLLG